MFGAHRPFLLILIALLAAAVPAGAGMAAAGRQQTTPVAPTPTAYTPAPKGQIAILAPTGSQTLQGLVDLVIQTDAPGMQFAELAFTYQDDPTDTWFMLYESNQPAGQMTVQWDTGAITDGNYKLRLTAAFDDGTFHAVQVENLRVRNYSPVETDTPMPAPTRSVQSTPESTLEVTEPATGQAQGAAPTETASVTPPPTRMPGTPQPNPAAIQPEQVGGSILRGGMAALGAFALAGVYWSVKRLGKRR